MALAAPHRTVSYCFPLPHADLRYPPSSISLHPEQHVGTGTNVTIRCWNKDYGTAFLLHKDGRSAPIQRLVPDDVGAVSFTLFGVTPADSGTYRCSYHPKASLVVSSPLGDSVTLEVTPTPAPPGRYKALSACPQCRPWVAVSSHPFPMEVMLGMNTPKYLYPTGAELVSRGNLVVAVVRDWAAVLIFALGIFFVIDARSLWIRRDESLGGEGI